MRARTAILLSALLALAARPARADDKPNVLLIVVDTLRADHLGSYGYARPTSPHLDGLAASGTRFAAARATSSWTAPSVASILTGEYPQNHGVVLPASALPRQLHTIAESFRDAGYRTAAFSANPAFVSPRQGFDRGFGEFYVLHSGFVDSEDEAADVVPGPTGSGKAVKVAAANQVTEQAVDWLGRIDGSQPFFLYAHYFDPHGGYYPPAEYAERFGVSAGSPMLKVDQHRFWKKAKPNAEELSTLRSLYDGEVAFTDAQIGRLLDALPKGRPTLIAMTADHGEEFLEHGGMSHGRTLFEEMLRVPMIFAGAGVKPGVVQQPVIIADVAPTLAEMAGLPPLAGIDGISLAPSVREGQEPPARPLFADETKANKEQEMLHRHAVLSGSQKLLQNMQIGYALFDLGEDPGEQHDLWASSGDRSAALESVLTLRESRKKDFSGWRSRPAPTVALSREDKERMRALGYDPE